jgi:hypothetical protein
MDKINLNSLVANINKENAIKIAGASAFGLFAAYIGYVDKISFNFKF